MKYFYTLLLTFILLPNLLLAQNLVPNPSFEDTVACPIGPGNINASAGWFSGSASVDFFHPCSNSLNNHVGVPDNFSGYQQPYGGAAFAGVVTYITINPNYREYLGVQLPQPLQAGVEYFVSAYISRGDSTYGGEVFDCATNNFGFRFTTTKYEAINLNPVPVDNFSHIHSDNVILDSVNWTQISGSFIADSAFSYLYIGNFYEAANTNVNTCSGTAYYYVDAVCVSTNAETCDIILGSSSFQSKNVISVYPNPAKDFISISIPSSTGAYDLNILDMQGREVLRKKNIPASQTLLSISQLQMGMFFIKVTQNNQYYFSKLIKQ